MSSPQDQSDLFEGRRRRDKIIDEHQRKRAWILGQVEHGLLFRVHCWGQAQYTADDAMDILDYLRDRDDRGHYPAELDTRFLGALWRKPYWKPVVCECCNQQLHVQSRRPERHARPIPVWRYSPEDAL